MVNKEMLWFYDNSPTKKLSVYSMLLIVAGDIETCPGPKYTCPTCTKTIRKNQKYGCCDTCSSRCHMKCLEDKLDRNFNPKCQILVSFYDV